MDALMTQYPAESVNLYRQQGLWGTLTIAQEFSRIAATRPDNIAVIDPLRTLTYAQLDLRSDAIALGLLDIGLESGDRVVLQVGNRATTIEAWYGLLKAGLVPICALDRHGHHEIDALAESSGAKAHLVDASTGARDLVAFAEEVAAVVPSMEALLTLGASPAQPGIRLEELGEVDASRAKSVVDNVQSALDPDGLAVLQLSGGTTGRPRLIPRLHAEYWYNAEVTASRCGMTEADRIAHVLPIVHNAGIHGALHAAHCVGGAILPAPADPDVFLPFLMRAGATQLLLVPGFAASLMKHKDFVPAISALKRLTLAAAAVPPGLFDDLSDLGVNVYQQFGMGEGLCMATPPGGRADLRRRTVGYPLSELDEVRVVDPSTLEDVGPGKAGELWARGPYTIRSYYNDPQASEERFTADGFYRSGDLVEASSVDGTLWYSVVGRIKEVINRGGEKVSPVEVELLLGEHPAIAAVAVVGVPDDRLGERACACVVPYANATVELNDLKHFLEQQGLARYKWPESLAIMDALPTTPVGKISRIALQAKVLDMTGTPS